jgi:phage FluMu gp28-like protein
MRLVLKELDPRVARVNDSNLTIDFTNGSRLQVRSADNEDSLRSAGLDGVVMDEAAFIPEGRWYEELRPALADKRGWALFASTPKGKNWFYRLEQQALDTPGWAHFHFTTAQNPRITSAEIADAKAHMPEYLFRQELLGEYIEAGAGVFRGFEKRCEPGKPHGHPVFFGVDWGKSNDFTVVSVVCPTCGRQVAQDRFNRIDYTLQISRLAAMADRWKPRRILAESNAMGQPLIDDLHNRHKLPIAGFNTNAVTKPALIEALSLAVERGDLTVLDDRVLVSELEMFELEPMTSGRFKFGAPAGTHDDCVIALALAWEAASHKGMVIRELDAE